jgi:YrbI family 3-deoxy-D-manno-octulosonate 8-phosphate phosphatase
MDLSKIKLIISEVDGIITEGLVGMGEMNIPMFKQFHLRDFEAINLIKRDWKFAFLAADAAISMSLCRKRNISFFHASPKKVYVYQDVVRHFGVTADSVLYIGSSYSDIECIQRSGVTMCPEDAVPQVKNNVDHVIPVYGGAGILCYVCEVLNGHRLRMNRKK